MRIERIEELRAQIKKLSFEEEYLDEQSEMAYDNNDEEAMRSVYDRYKKLAEILEPLREELAALEAEERRENDEAVEYEKLENRLLGIA